MSFKIPRGTECSVNGESLITTRYNFALSQQGIRIWEKCLRKRESSTLTNLVIVFHNNIVNELNEPRKDFSFFREVEKIH